MQREFRDYLVKLYNKDVYHIDFVDKVLQIVPDDLWDLYVKVLSLSLEAPFNKELNESYQIAIELLCKGLKFEFDENGILCNKEV